MGPKLLKLQNYRFQKLLGHKNLSPKKLVGPGKLLGHKKFWLWKILGHKKSTVKFLSQKILCQIKFWILENFGSWKMLGPKNLSLKKFTIPKDFHRKFCVRNIYFSSCDIGKQSQLLTKLAQVRSVSSNLSSKLS